MVENNQVSIPYETFWGRSVAHPNFAQRVGSQIVWVSTVAERILCDRNKDSLPLIMEACGWIGLGAGAMYGIFHPIHTPIHNLATLSEALALHPLHIVGTSILGGSIGDISGLILTFGTHIAAFAGEVSGKIASMAGDVVWSITSRSQSETSIETHLLGNTTEHGAPHTTSVPIHNTGIFDAHGTILTVNPFETPNNMQLIGKWLVSSSQNVKRKMIRNCGSFMTESTVAGVIGGATSGVERSIWDKSKSVKEHAADGAAFGALFGFALSTTFTLVGISVTRIAAASGVGFDLIGDTLGYISRRPAPTQSITDTRKPYS
jgi:hypothetical protein